MRLLIQRVRRASVTVEGAVLTQIESGLLILIGIEAADEAGDADWLAMKVAKIRLFADPAGLMNLSISDVNGSLLIVSQFTLHASTKKGNRPSFLRAARPEQAIPLYEYFLLALERETASRVSSGKFGADMQVELVNDGPVTVWIDSRQRE